ncbi:unnamed protein product [Lasius platythorax]|uniref:Uncharacterized protein n=1 Tax=Lasius platythorax TaxID=488582 RepID=A0AAV2NKY8_9HYME
MCEKILQKPVRLPAYTGSPVRGSPQKPSPTSKMVLPSRLLTIPVPIRHNRIFIGDLFIHDAGHARQIFSLAKFFSPGSNILREQR